jgi:hypothetical protein
VAGELLCYFAHDSPEFLVLLRHLHSILNEPEWKDAELCQSRMIKSGTTWRSERIGLGFELPSKNAVVGPTGPTIKSEPVWRWLQVFDSREINSRGERI